jgi:hypothetical protein
VLVPWTPKKHLQFPEKDQRSIVLAHLLFKRKIFGKMSKDVFLNILCPKITDPYHEVVNQNVGKQFFMFKQPNGTLCLVTTKNMLIAIHRTNGDSPDLCQIELLHSYAD